MAHQPVIDTHVHFYDPAQRRQSWIADKPVLQGAHGPADLDAARGAVAIAALVAVEAGLDPGQHLAEAAWFAELAADEPRIAGIVAAAPLERGQAALPDLERLAELPLVKGVRRLIQDEPDPEFCLQPAFIEGVRLLPRCGFSFDLCLYHHQLPAVIRLVQACPEVAFILDHIAKPGIKAGLVDPWRDHLSALAALPNVVACKLSGVITEADHAAWQADQIRPYLDHALACFGSERAMFGSDWPVSNLTHGYGQWVAMVEQAVADAGLARQAVFLENARRVYRLGAPG